MLPEDLDSSHRFFLALPEEDRLHLRLDVTDRENVRMLRSGRVLIQDADGNRFEIPDIKELDAHSQRLLDSEI